MSATSAGAVKAYIETLGLGLPVFRDGAPKGLEPAAYIVVQEGIGTAPEAHGDYGDQAAHQAEREQLQVDLIEPARIPTAGSSPTRSGEDGSRVTALRRGLHGGMTHMVYGTPPLRVYGCRVVAGQRWPPADNVVRHTLTIELRRDA